MKPEIDEVSGQETTGHEWDGITELKTPTPKAMTWSLYISIGIAAGMWIAYPAWPYISGYTKGIFGYSTRAAVTKDLAEYQEKREAFNAELFAKPIDELAHDDAIKEKYFSSTSVLFADNCAACHGTDLQGQTGFPNLVDDAWLWSGLPSEIETVITYGINSYTDDALYSQMPAFGRYEMLTYSEIDEVTEFVQSLSGTQGDVSKIEAGRMLFADNCAACHGDDGKGGLENGAPNLTDEAWIYGGDRDDIVESLRNGRQGFMPQWATKISEADIRKLALYVYWNGDEQEK